MKQLSLLFLFLPFFTCSEEKIHTLSQRAQAFWEAHDYTAASLLYKPLLLHSLPDWQQARLLYNLGTIRLAQHRTQAAINLFQKINPTTLSLPHFGRDLLLNQGIAYLQYAQTLTIPSLDLQQLFIEQSLQIFDHAYLLECQIQQAEQTTCHHHTIIDRWKKAAYLQLQAIYQKKRKQWLEQTTIDTLASFLHIHLQQLIQHVETFQEQNPNFAIDLHFLAYVQQQAKSFLPAWNSLQQKDLQPSQKIAFDQAVHFYLDALQILQQQDFFSALNKLKQAAEALNPLTFQDHIPLQQTMLNYAILLLQESVSTTQIQALLAKFEQLKIEEIQKDLQLSLKEMQAQHRMQARFFLLAGATQAEALLEKKNLSSLLILQQAIVQANRALYLFLLTEMMTDEIPSKKGQMQAVVKKQQHAVLTRAAPFIAAVLKEEEKNFQKAKNPMHACQQFPWEQVIPLFDRGLQAAQEAEKALNTSEPHAQSIAFRQQQTIREWQQTLLLMKHPPSSTNESSAPQSPSETFRLIQEMYLQDQSLPKQTDQELHSW